MNKKIGSLLLIILIISSMLTGCGKSLVKESIEQAKIAIENKEYDKAISSLEVALEEDSTNHDANLLYVIVETYQRASKLLEEGKVDEAKRVIDTIEEEYKDYAIKEDVESLKQKIEDRLEEVKLIDSNLVKLQNLVDEKKYTEAKSLIEEINKSTLSEEQKSKLDPLKTKVDTELAEIAKKEEANKKVVTSNNNNTSSSTTTTDKNKETESSTTVVQESHETTITIEKKEEVVITKEEMVNESVQYFVDRGVNVKSSSYEEVDGSNFNSGIAELDGHKIFAFTVDSYDFKYYNAWFYYSPETKVGYKYQYRRWTKL